MHACNTQAFLTRIPYHFTKANCDISVLSNVTNYGPPRQVFRFL